MRSTFLLHGCIALMLASCTEPRPDPRVKPAQAAAEKQAPKEKVAELEAAPVGHLGKGISENTAEAKGPEKATEEAAASDAARAEVQAEDPSTLQEAPEGKAYGQILIQTSAEDVFVAELTIVRDEGVKARTGRVRYTAEPNVLLAVGKATVSEANFVGSGLAVDLDGDGKTKSKIKTRCEEGVVVLETKPPTRIEAVTEFTEDVVRFVYGDGGSRLASTDRAGAVLYSPCDKGLTFGLDPAKPLTLLETGSPSVFLVYRGKIDAASDADPFALESIKVGEEELAHTVHPFREYHLTKGDTPEIFAANLVVFEIDALAALQHITVKISGERPEFITASINEVDADGHRIRYADGFKRF